MAPDSVSAGCKGIHRCGRYPVSADPPAEEGKKEPAFRSAHTCDRPPTGKLIRSPFVPHADTAAVAVTTYAGRAYRSPVATQ